MNILSRSKWFFGVALCMLAPSAFAALNIFACTPEWGSLAKELAGDKANIYTATNALQDPHHVEARPSLIARARSADLVICTGADLEVGWLPLVLTQSGNPKIRAGQPGNFEASRFVIMLEVPSSVDRSQGDVHPGGNPHIHLDPRNIAKVAAALAERMAQLDAIDSEGYRQRAKNFLERWQQAIARWEKDGAPLKGMAKDPAKAVVRSAYNDPRAAEWLTGNAKIPAVTLAFTVGGNDKVKDLFSLFDDTLARLLAVTK